MYRVKGPRPNDNPANISILAHMLSISSSFVSIGCNTMSHPHILFISHIFMIRSDAHAKNVIILQTTEDDDIES